MSEAIRRREVRRFRAPLSRAPLSRAPRSRALRSRTPVSRAPVSGAPAVRASVLGAIVLLALSAAWAPSVAQTIQLVELTTLPNAPSYLTHAGDGSGRLFVVDLKGTIWIWDGAQLLATPFLDISAQVGSLGAEQGLFSVAFHPDYEINGYFFVDYTDTNGDTVVERFSVSADPDVADPLSGSVVLQIAQPATGHNAGQLNFGPNDGYLYISTGDGGEPGDPNDYSQRVDSLLGKILRIDVDAGSPYSIPDDNPYAGIDGDDEIWATGLRNPWRFSFDRTTGDLFVADVGFTSFEEINFQPAGSGGCENYGWRLMEASVCHNPVTGCNPGLPTGCNPTGALELPIIEYAHQGSPCDSVTGGYIYRGADVPGLVGVYVYADYCRGEIWGAMPDGGGVWESTLLFDAPYRISSFGEDEDGELYVLQIEPVPTVYRIVGPALELSLTGTCPGPVTFDIESAPPNSEVAVVAANNLNGFAKSGIRCNGVFFTIGEPFQLPPTQIFVDASGEASGAMTLSPDRCFVQALAGQTCELSNAVEALPGPSADGEP